MRMQIEHGVNNCYTTKLKGARCYLTDNEESAVEKAGEWVDKINMFSYVSFLSKEYDCRLIAGAIVVPLAPRFKLKMRNFHN